MSSFRDAVKCTVHDGEMLMHLDNGCVNIPQELLNESQILKDALSVAYHSSTQQVILAAPNEWLQAWAACYCNEEGNLSCAEIDEFVNCLLVCSFFECDAAAVVLIIGYCAVTLFTACRMLGSTPLSRDLKVILIRQLLANQVRKLFSENLYTNQAPGSHCRQLTYLPFRATYRTYVVL
jgi:hypothetical protein